MVLLLVWCRHQLGGVSHRQIPALDSCESNPGRTPEAPGVLTFPGVPSQGG